MTILTTPNPGDTVPLIIGGREILTSSTFDVVNPSTQLLIHKASSASVADADAAVKAAADAFPAWAAMPPGQRRNIFLKAADIMEARAKELGQYVIEETGSVEFWAEGFNIPLGTDILRDCGARICSIGGSIPVTR